MPLFNNTHSLWYIDRFRCHFSYAATASCFMCIIDLNHSSWPDDAWHNRHFLLRVGGIGNWNRPISIREGQGSYSINWKTPYTNISKNYEVECFKVKWMCSALPTRPLTLFKPLVTSQYFFCTPSCKLVIYSVYV